jgi:type I restriction enzyme S subunit
MKNKQFIGDFLKRIKRPISLNPDKDYRLVTIKMNHNGVVLRGLKKGADIKSNMYEVKEGDFILSGIDARNGAFGIIPKELDGAIVTNDFWYFDIDEDTMNKKLFLELTSTSWFDDICKKGSDGTTQRIRLQKDKFFNQEIDLPLPNEQNKLLEKIHSIKDKQKNLQIEQLEQKKLVEQLNESILDEAIKGTLSSNFNISSTQFPDLFQLIKEEKQRLIDEKLMKN